LLLRVGWSSRSRRESAGVQVEVDEATARTLEFAARMAGMGVGELIARLVRQASLPEETSVSGDDSKEERRLIGIQAVYEGYLVRAVFDRLTQRVEIEDGPLAGQSFKSPTGAARAVVSHYKPSVSPHRNGWAFWSVSGTNELLQSIRQRS
jgi:hypothetical protein